MKIKVQISWVGQSTRIEGSIKGARRPKKIKRQKDNFFSSSIWWEKSRFYLMWGATPLWSNYPSSWQSKIRTDHSTLQSEEERICWMDWFCRTYFIFIYIFKVCFFKLSSKRQNELNPVVRWKRFLDILPFRISSPHLFFWPLVRGKPLECARKTLAG